MGKVGLTSAVVYDMGDGSWLAVAEVMNNTTARRVGIEVAVKFFGTDGHDLGYTWNQPVFVDRLAYGARAPVSISGGGIPDGAASVDVVVYKAGTTTAAAPGGGLTVVPNGWTPSDDGRTWKAVVTNPNSFAVRDGRVAMTTYDVEGEIVDAWLTDFIEIPSGGTFDAGIEVFDDPAAARAVFIAGGVRAGTSTYVTSWNNYFNDVGVSSFRRDIEWLAANRITLGCGPARYCPEANVRRDEMASFLARALGLVNSAPDAFVDDAGNPHAPNINRIAAEGIASGCNPVAKLYCPANNVRRDEMASFLSRALRLTGTPANAFTDDNGNTHELSINRMAAAGVTSGCGPSKYCPTENVTRGQMAAFLRRAFEE